MCYISQYWDNYLDRYRNWNWIRNFYDTIQFLPISLSIKQAYGRHLANWHFSYCTQLTDWKIWQEDEERESDNCVTKRKHYWI